MQQNQQYSQYREPPPYPGTAPGSKTFLQPGQRQSYSGSETSTDVSLSSNENLCPSIRQDPQGEENTHPALGTPIPHHPGVSYHDGLQQALMETQWGGIDAQNSILARLGMHVPNLPGTSQVEVPSTNTGVYFVTGSSMSQVTHPHQAVHQYVNVAPTATMRNPTVPHHSALDVASSFTTQAINRNKMPVFSTEVQSKTQQIPTFHLEDHQSTQQPPQGQNTCNHGNTAPNQLNPSLMVPVTAQIVRSQTAPVVLQQHSHPTQLQLAPTHTSSPAPAQAQLLSANTQKAELRRSYEVLDKVRLTRSQPDLSKMIDQKPAKIQSANQVQANIQSANQMPANIQSANQMQANIQSANQMQANIQSANQMQAKVLSANQEDGHVTSRSAGEKQDEDHAAIAARATQMVEILSVDNRTLREELENYYKKVAKLQKFEMEIQRAHDSHEALVQHSARRENLEKTMRLRLETALRKLKQENRDLKEEMEKRGMGQPTELYELSDNEMKKELARKDSTISKLLSQNKELTNVRERLEIENVASKAGLQEQKKHIEVLDSALMNAQTTIIKLEQQLRYKSGEEDKVLELQKTLSTLQDATEKREGLEHKLRGKLEEEIRTLKNIQSPGSGKTSDTDEGIASDTESPTSVQSLIQSIQQKEQRILELEADIIRWEQKFVEETALRQIAIDVTATPKDARIAALEQSSVETEQIIADVRTEKYKHMEEVYHANRKCAELEAKVKLMQAQMAEKDALIRVLQKHSSLSRTGSVTSLLSSPCHSAHGSITSSTSLSSSPRSPRQSISASPSPLLPRASSILPQRPLSATSRPLSPLQVKVMSRKGNILDKSLIHHAKSNSTGTSVTLKELKLYPPESSSGAEGVSKVLWQV